MKKISIGAVIGFVVLAVVGGFLATGGEGLWDRLFGGETEPGTEKKMEQSGDIVQCEYCGIKIPEEHYEFHKQNCTKNP